MDRSGISTIEFRLLGRALATGARSVQVAIDRESLENRYNSANGEWASSRPLCTWPPQNGVTPLELWSSSFDSSSDMGEICEEGRIAVLTCSCGHLMWGGAVADSAFTYETVTWSNFRHANYLTRKGIGPFVFARSPYDRALRAAAQADQPSS
jgi:hypothetical protein